MSKYVISDTTKNQIERTYRPCVGRDGQLERFVAISAKARELAMLIASETQPCREQSVALTHLENAILWANSAIAHEG